jgi:predicted NBD/HSP70 family sugar kinase
MKGGPLDIARGCVDGSPNLPGWTGFSITDFLSNSFGGLPARIDNDCTAAALGETNVVYITVSPMATRPNSATSP